LSQEVSLTIAQRWFFLVDLQGIVRGQWRGTKSEVFPSEAILKAIPKIEENR
jgi:hypothetical protein